MQIHEQETTNRNNSNNMLNHTMPCHAMPCECGGEIISCKKHVKRIEPINFGTSFRVGSLTNGIAYERT